MFEVTARLRIHEGQLEGFEQQATEMMRQTREKDTKTLRYDWFISDDAAQCEVLEGYLDADGLLEHSEHIGDARAELFRDFAYDHDMSIYGEPSPALANAIEAMADHVNFHRYSLFQRLDAESSADGTPRVFEASARLKIRDGELEGFGRQVAEILKQTRQQDSKPLRYDWFLSEDGSECQLREAYADADALLEQQRRLGETKAKLFRYLTGHSMTFYGEPSPALASALEAMGTTFRQFSFFQGLDSDVKIRDAIPA